MKSLMVFWLQHSDNPRRGYVVTRLHPQTELLSSPLFCAVDVGGVDFIFVGRNNLYCRGRIRVSTCSTDMTWKIKERPESLVSKSGLRRVMIIFSSYQDRSHNPASSVMMKSYFLKNDCSFCRDSYFLRRSNSPPSAIRHIVAGSGMMVMLPLKPLVPVPTPPIILSKLLDPWSVRFRSK